MSKKKKGSQVWVHPNFKKKLKVMASTSDMSILELTKVLGESQNEKKHKKSTSHSCCQSQYVY